MNRTLKLFLALVSLCMTVFCFAQKSELRFNKDGKFKIVQFTDVHFKYKNPASDIALERINQVLDEEQPDFVIFTGDVVYSAPADKGMLQVLEQVSKRKLPFVVTFGNHDNEQGMTREQLYDIIRQVPGNLMPDRGSVLSPDYVLTVNASSDAKKDAAVLYCMDSHSYSPLKDVKGYAWLTLGKVPDCLDSPVHHHICDALGNLDRNGQHANLHVIFFHLLQKVVRMVDRNPVEVSADQSRVYIKSSHNLKPEMLQTGVLQKCASQTADSKKKSLMYLRKP